MVSKKVCRIWTTDNSAVRIKTPQSYDLGERVTVYSKRVVPRHETFCESSANRTIVRTTTRKIDPKGSKHHYSIYIGPKVMI